MSVIYRALSLGAGVQSSVLALMLSEGDERTRRAGYEAPDLAVFADTGWEPEYVYEHLDWLEGRLGFRCIRVSAGNIKDDLHGGVDPAGKGMLFRRCTKEYKIRPIQRAIKLYAGGVYGRPFPNGEQVEQWLGISVDEASRMRDAREKWIVNRYPLVDIGMSRDDCRSWWEERYPSRALRRSACVICPYRSKAAWLEIEKDSPEDYADAVEFDEWIRSEGAPSIFTEKWGGGRLYSHSSWEPLCEVVDAARNAPRTLNMFENECEGICGV